jgi:hypothetical protein
MAALELLAVRLRSDPKQQAGLVMWIEKLSDGVLRVLTPFGSRYIRPSFRQRFYLLWTFRYFDTLPLQVLSSWQRRLIDDLCSSQNYVSGVGPGWQDVPLLGTVERHPPRLVEESLDRNAGVGIAEPAGARLADQRSS